jgi:hypothetical protein
MNLLQFAKNRHSIATRKCVARARSMCEEARESVRALALLECAKEHDFVSGHSSLAYNAIEGAMRGSGMGGTSRRGLVTQRPASGNLAKGGAELV